MTPEQWREQFEVEPECVDCRTTMHLDAGAEWPEDATPETLRCWGCLWDWSRRAP